ncbi:hypothetical protein BN948_01747 [Hydrogenophaga intermedia]|uniref:Uncharacterized protein n=1 Tax=Hydrogenophaga intermedia TaxID=65786 RepID=A0A1L1PK65_HYDIT|nr:hypothetical protein [Hydrogenophaga intermedia]CDN87327.1 hypothetical protein BN948_01747 [Hydrogenophaga intermedia]
MAKSKKSHCCIGPDEEWRAESDARTLIEAEKIKADAKRLEKARAWAAKQVQDAAAVAATKPTT